MQLIEHGRAKEQRVEHLVWWLRSFCKCKKWMEFKNIHIVLITYNSKVLTLHELEQQRRRMEQQRRRHMGKQLVQRQQLSPSYGLPNCKLMERCMQLGLHSLVRHILATMKCLGCMPMEVHKVTSMQGAIRLR